MTVKPTVIARDFSPAIGALNRALVLMFHCFTYFSFFIGAFSNQAIRSLCQEYVDQTWANRITSRTLELISAMDHDKLPEGDERHRAPKVCRNSRISLTTGFNFSSVECSCAILALLSLRKNKNDIWVSINSLQISKKNYEHHQQLIEKFSNRIMISMRSVS